MKHLIPITHLSTDFGCFTRILEAYQVMQRHTYDCCVPKSSGCVAAEHCEPADPAVHIPPGQNRAA